VPEQFPLPFQPPVPRPKTGGRPGGRAKPTGPGPATQAHRLGPVFANLRDALDAERVQVTEEPEAASPDVILVMEIAGDLDEFVGAVRSVDGLEYLAEELGDKIEDKDLFAAVDKDGKRSALRRELFVVASDRRAADQLDQLWRMWQAGEKLPRGFGTWRHVFERLDVVRRWDDRDRLTRTGALEVWRAELANRDATDVIPLEVELWFRASSDRRDAEEDRLRKDLEEAGGELVRSFVLDDIDYHGVLARLPAGVLVEMTEKVQANWLSGNGVRFMRAVGQVAMPVFERPEFAEVVAAEPSPRAGNSPRVAILDGVPVANHRALQNRIVLDDPDSWEESTEVKHRRHGTEMASVVVHGDLALAGAPLRDPVYVRPIIRVDPADAWVDTAEEAMPSDRLPVELVYEAVVRMLDGDEPQAPDVRIINISVGDRAQQFDRFLSPWARLLDHLSAQYEVLFVVSAGNHQVELEFATDVDLDDPEELQAETLTQLGQTLNYRRLLAPADSVNALSVGAAQVDAGEIPDDDRHNPLSAQGLPSPGSSCGPGHSRGIKPDLLAPGGRQLFQLQPSVPGDDFRRMTPSYVARPPGIQAAVPAAGGDLTKSSWICGTSPAAALVTRAGAQALERLDELRDEWGDRMPGPEFDAVLVKAFLVHSAAWSGGAGPLTAALRDAGLDASKEVIQRFLGYGLLRDGWSIYDDDYRATALYASRIGDGEHVYRLPLPPSLSGNPIWRRLTLTLAWFTPVNLAHRGYRRAALRVDPKGSLDFVRNRQEADGNSVARGTVQHEILESRGALAFQDGDSLEFVITNRAAAGTLDGQVPYAFLVTLETAVDLQLPIYAEVSTRLRQRIAPRVGAVPTT
jgi:hypothetical protein